MTLRGGGGDDGSERNIFAVVQLPNPDVSLACGDLQPSSHGSCQRLL